MLFSENDKTLPDYQLFNITTDKSSYNIGDTAHITIASSAENIAVTITVEKDRTIIKKEIITLNNNKRVISVPVTQDDFGGFAVNYSFAAFNSFQSGDVAIAVPYPSTDLDIETLTFRDKLQPGTDETWQFKIKGPKGDKVSAELLASMYDASLDQFKPHSWNFNAIQTPTYNPYGNTTAYKSFGKESFRVYQERFSHHFTPQSYDRLNWFGFTFGNYFPSRLRKALSGRVSGIQIMEDNAELEEVVVVGYGSQKREGITGAVAAVSPEQLNAGGDLKNVEKTLNSISKEEAKELLDSSRESEKNQTSTTSKSVKTCKKLPFSFRSYKQMQRAI